MSKQESNVIISQGELEAAIAEIEAAVTGDETRIPSLDDERGDHVVPVPVPAPPTTPRAGSTAPTEAIQPDQAPAPAAGVPTAVQRAAADQPTRDGTRPVSNLLGRAFGLIRRLWPARRGRGGVATPVAAPEAGSKPAAGARSGNLLVRLIDLLLDLVNRPFYWVPPEARRVLGLAGIVTIIMSLLAAAALPRLLPRHDPVTFIHQKRAEQLATQSQPGVEEPP